DLINSKNDRFFLKPDYGKGGNGIKVIKKKNGELFYLEENLTKHVFLNMIKKEELVLQPGIYQNNYLYKINFSTVNTLRVITQRIKEGVKISIVVMRMGRKNSEVDNSAQGGISVGINPSTGKFDNKGFVEHGNTVYEIHPDSGFVFKGKNI